MNPHIHRLATIANKKERIIVGLMSGTSLDGLDIALCKIAGSRSGTHLELIHFETVEYSDEMRKEISKVFAKKNIELEKLCVLHPWIAMKHAAIVNNCLKKWQIKNEDVDLLASHGQTVFHSPKGLRQKDKFGNATLQIGDGDHLAVATGIITISDFRQKHIALGGEGAPLALYGDQILFGKKGEERILLNIGGIANFTYLPGSTRAAEVVCTDTGPGNTMMDAFIQQQFPGKYFDKDASLASLGRVNFELLALLKASEFFNLPVPKTTGPELFNLSYLSEARQRSNTENCSAADTMATLNRFTADTIAEAIDDAVRTKRCIHIYLSGGGMHNPLLVKNLSQQLPGHAFHSTSELGINPDAKEAMLFAILANETVCGDEFVSAKKSAGMPVFSLGKISFPS